MNLTLPNICPYYEFRIQNNLPFILRASYTWMLVKPNLMEHHTNDKRHK